MIEAEFISTLAYPALEPKDAFFFLDHLKRINIQAFIKSRNMEFKSANQDLFFASLVTRQTIQNKFNLPLEAIDLLLNWAMATWNLIGIQLPDTVKSSQQDAGQEVFVCIDFSTIELLLLHSSTLLEKEYLKMYASPVNKINIPDMACKKISEHPNSSLDIFYRFYDSLLAAKTGLTNAALDQKAREDIEKRILISIRRFYHITEEIPLALDSVAQNLSDQSGRRAADSLQWKQYETKNKKDGIIDWFRSFEHLGPYFSTRIMLRKELFVELESCINKYTAWNENEAQRVNDDILKTIYTLEKKKYDPEKLQILQNIKNVLENLPN